MPTAVTGAFARVQQFYSQFSLPQRTLALIGIAGLLLGAIALASWAARPTMSPVFTAMSATDASAVVDHLEAEGVPYELTDGGSTVLVPAEQLYDQRIALAAAGLPTKQDGYSLLDDMGMTSSDFQQQVTYQRALEGELARTVEAISGVETATVHLALPEDSVFVDRAVDPTASVFVQLQTGTSLSSGAVQSIINLISSAIPDMNPGGVSVVDAEGRVLTPDGAGGVGGATEYESGVVSQVQAMLDRVVGVGNAVVSVTAELNRDATERTSETFTPADGTPPLSSSTSTEEYTGGGQAVGGVLGPDNIAVPQDGAGEGSYLREDEVVNNPVNKVTEHTTVNPGGVRRQSVSVVVDTQAAAGLDLNELNRMVSTAAGADEARGDQVAVSQMAFDTSAADAAAAALTQAEEAAAAERQADLLRMGIIAAVVLVVVLAIVLAVRAARRDRREEIDLGELEMLREERLLPQDPEGTSVLPAADPAPALSPTAEDPDVTARAELANLASEDPAAVAERLREWLAVRR